ncbi:SLC13 family permease [Pseudaminobacter sp. 19-2017]|uniref:SLC13 family permease n=1 Tax=Pseudaminobacter soli (ex Zhang et al. 2022) TaxID=2831468 RepID=A0A942DW19_9HYPH|nr:SLC13 family permease [Pseudaminobacter soli]MBS3648624.1 SLC13 family permease [Pseudaminobacter soli]
MTFEQAAILVLLAAMLVLFALDRIRMEVVALGGLALGYHLGLVPVNSLFSGFSHSAVITVVEILLIVQVLSRSAVLDLLADRITAIAPGRLSTIAALCGLSAFVSAIMNNIGALALMLPIVFSVCHGRGIDPKAVLMPVSFAALLGGTCSIIGTPANLVVSQQLATVTGHGFAFFDYAYAGVPGAIAGIIAIVAWVPRLFAIEPSKISLQGEVGLRRKVAELAVPAASPLVGTSLADFPLTLYGVQRNEQQLFLARNDQQLAAGDRLLVEGSEAELSRLVATGALAYTHHAIDDETVQAVVMPESTVVGSRIGNVGAFAAGGVTVLSVSPQTHRIEGSFSDIQLSIGDVLVLAGNRDAIREAISETELLEVSGASRSDVGSPLPLAIFAAGIVLAAFGVAPDLAFGAVVLVLAALGNLNLRTALADLNWPILLMLAAMIPLGAAVGTTGAADVLSGWLLHIVPTHQSLALSAAMLLLAVLITPFVNNATTAIVLGPVAISAAQAAGVAPEPVLIAVALGASIDFLTPFGHHNNTVVMGIAGYRFTDFAKAGWPATLAAGVVALVMIALVWV